jgi:hypothetical protein
MGAVRKLPVPAAGRISAMFSWAKVLPQKTPGTALTQFPWSLFPTARKSAKSKIAFHAYIYRIIYAGLKCKPGG